MKRLFQTNLGYIILFSVVVWVIITPLFQHGLFGDGLLYQTVAFNRFKGYGSFWNQHFSDSSMQFFCEQPPLYFEALALFYKLFGGAEIAERVFTIVLLLTGFLFIHLIWNKLNEKSKHFKQLAWFPNLAMMLMPVLVWTFCNQVIETMVIPLSLAAFYVQLLYIKEQSITKKVLLFFTILALLFCLLLTKGVQSTFALAVLFLAGISWQKKNFKPLLLQNALLVIGFGLLSFLFFYYINAANFWLKSYFDKRLVATFNHVGATTNNHLEIIFRYLTELLPLAALMLLLMVYFKTSTKYPYAVFLKNIKSNSVMWWLLLVSISGAIPLSLTLEQRGFYITPAIPFAALAFAFACKRYLFVLFARLSRYKVVLTSFASILLMGSLLFFTLFKDSYKRDEAMLKDIALLKHVVPYGDVIGFDKIMWNNFSLHAYLNKANNNSLTTSDTTFFFILEKGNKAQPPTGFKKINCTTYWLDIYYQRNSKR